MSRSVTAVLASAALLAAGAGISRACTCGWVPLETEIANTPVIFTGIVVRVTQADPYYTDLGLEVEIVPTAYWKGSLQETTLVYTNPGGSAVCGVSFDVGSEWLIFAGYTPASKLYTNTCSSTHKPYEGDPVLEALGPPNPVQTLGASWGRVKAIYR